MAFPKGNQRVMVYPKTWKKGREPTREQKGTIFLSTPTFYRTYLRKFNPEDFKSVRIAGAGAEKLKASLAEAWEEKFGSPLLEGYGCTELSPVVSVNLPDLDVPGFRQKTRKLGTIGLPVPGVVTRIVDPESGEDLAHGEPGLFFVGDLLVDVFLNRLLDEYVRHHFAPQFRESRQSVRNDQEAVIVNFGDVAGLIPFAIEGFFGQIISPQVSSHDAGSLDE